MTAIHRPTTLATAGDGPFAAGCTALQLAWGDGPPATLTDISGLPGAHGISLQSGQLRIGALETLERCRTHPLVRAHAPLLAQACAVVGALGVRLLATLGGNIGWRQGDLIPALLALGAAVETVDGVQKLDGLLGQAPMPLMLAVLVPRAPPIAVFEKIGHRAAFSLSAVTVAGGLEPGLSLARLAACGAGHSARRLRMAEAVFARGRPDQGAVEAAIAREVDWPAGRIAARVLAGLLFAAIRA